MGYDRENDINRIFIEDSRDKKRTGIGIHKRASRKGYIRGGIKTAYDFMSTKERKKLNGEVRVYSMYDIYKDLNNCKLDEILSKEDNDITKILTTIKENNSSTKIFKHFKISGNRLYSLYRKYGVPLQPKPPRAINTDKVLISKEKFALMDSIDKSKYINKIIDSTGLSYSKIALHFEVSKSTITHYANKINDKKKNKKDAVEEDIVTQMTLEPTDIQEVAIGKEEKVELNSQETQKLHDEILKLQKENKKLIDHIMEISKENATSKFKGLRIEINGEYAKKELSNRLLSLDEIMVDDKRYNIEVLLEEIL